MTHDDFLPYVLPYAKGCPDLVAVQAIRQALIELCTESMVWRTYQRPVSTVALQTAYSYAPVSGQRAVRLLSLTLDGSGVELVAPDVGREMDGFGYVSPYAYGGLVGFELRPAQVAGLPIVTYAAVCPDLKATTLPNDFARYTEQVARGALSRVLSTKDKEYSDAARGAALMMQWKSDIDGAKSDAYDGMSRVTQRTRKVWF